MKRMSIHTEEIMNNSQQNKVLLNEVKNVLDAQEALLDFPVQSRLTQARFHAIDRGFLNKSRSTYKAPLVRSKLGVVSALAVIMIIVLSLFINFSLFYSHSSNPLLISPMPKNQDQIKTVESSEDTKEEVDIYDWLYEHYG